MSDGFIKLNRSPEFLELMKKPKAFTLLCLIASRTKYTDVSSILGLQKGEALIGDPKACGLSRQEYRTAIQLLQKHQIITTKVTNKGTIAKIINTSIIEVFKIDDNQPIPIKQPSNNQPVTTNKERKNIYKKTKAKAFTKKNNPADKFVDRELFSNNQPDPQPEQQNHPPPQSSLTTTTNQTQEKGTKTNAKRKTIIPENWQPTEEDRAFALSKSIRIEELDDVIREFTNHHTNKQNKFINWSKAFENWCIGNKRYFSKHSNATTNRQEPPSELTVFRRVRGWWRSIP